MQLATASAPARLTPSQRPSADHASFDLVSAAAPDGIEQRLGLRARSQFWTTRGSFDDAVAGARELAGRKGTAFAVLDAHPGMLFVVPVHVRGTDPAPRLAADLGAWAQLPIAGRHGAMLALVGAETVRDLREVPVQLGSGRA